MKHISEVLPEALAHCNSQVYSCAMCHKPVKQEGSTVRMVDGLRRRVGQCCAPPHVKAEKRLTYGSPIDRMALLVQYLLSGRRLSRVEAAAALECSSARTKDYLEALHDAALVHVERWERKHCGPWYEVFAWCGGNPKADAPKPSLAKGVRNV